MESQTSSSSLKIAFSSLLSLSLATWKHVSWELSLATACTCFTHIYDQDQHTPRSSSLVRIHFLNPDHHPLRVKGTLILVCNSSFGVPHVQQDIWEVELDSILPKLVADCLNKLEYKLESFPVLISSLEVESLLLDIFKLPLISFIHSYSRKWIYGHKM